MSDAPGTTNSATGEDHTKPSYLERLKAYVEPVLSWGSFLEALPETEAEGFLISNPECRWSNQDAYKVLRAVDNGILIIQNVSINLITVLGDMYDIDIAFFPHYFYQEGHPQFGKLGPFNQTGPLSGWHLDCMTGARLSVKGRRNFWYLNRMQNADTSIRFSFYTLTPALYLVLIDGPRLSANHFALDNVATPADLCRAMPNLGWLPGSVDQLCLLHRMNVFYRHSWNLEMLRYCSSELLGGTTSPWVILDAFCGHLKAYFLDSTIKLLAMYVSALSHHAVEQPNLDSLARLNDCRRMVQLLRENLRDRPSGMTNDVCEWEAEALLKIGSHVKMAKGYFEFESKSVIEKQKDVDQRAAELLASLTESFQLLIGAIGVMDSDINKKQAERSTMLTVMAAIYLPLSLGTGIFGMNVKEINGDGSNARWWAVVVAIAIISCPSVLFVVYIFTKGRIRTWRSKRKLAEMEV